MADECLICKAPLVYRKEDVEMECLICHKKESSKSACSKGHYVCSACHMRGIDQIFVLCMQEKGTDPIAILEKMMAMSFCHMHGPEHHVMVGAALLTAYKNAGGVLDLAPALTEMMKRGRAVPGGACGYWGACGAGVSTGMYISIVTDSTPLAQEEWGLSNLMTSCALGKIGAIGGPRCCKRDSYLAISAAAAFTKEKLGIEMHLPEIRCTRSRYNNQCIRNRCPFYPEESL